MKKKLTIRKDIKKIEKEIDKEVKEVEDWIYQRRKFFIKLGWVILLVLALFGISYLI